MKKQILISLISLSSIFTTNAQFTAPVSFSLATYNWEHRISSGNGDYYLYDVSNARYAFTIQKSNGNLGIGTTNPLSTLSIRNPQLTDNATTGSVDLSFYTTNNPAGYGTKISTFKDGGTVGNLAGLAFFTQYGWTAPVERMRISSLGNVAIGSPYTNSTLSIRNTQLANDATSGTVDLSFYTTDSPNGYGTKISTYKETFNTAGLAFYTQYGYASPVEKMRITSTGNVGIGTITPSYKLDVCGTIRAQEVKVDLAGGCDFVFKSDYKLMDLKKLEEFVKTNQHLPEIASEKEMVENGVNLKDLQMKLLQKMEEVTLYIIEQNKKIETLENEIKELKRK